MIKNWRFGQFAVRLLPLKEAQMYKVFVNDIPLFLGTPDSVGELGLLPDKTAVSAPYIGKRKVLKWYVDLLEKTPTLRACALYADDVEKMWADFRSCFHHLQAAGGYVLNADHRLLVMYRRGRWDMPKGKMDEGETPADTAVREVREETGLHQLTLGPFLTHTWHTYRDRNGDRVLKQTHWYHMTTSDTQLIPQTEEDIERLEWVAPQAWLAEKPDVFASIRDVIVRGMSLAPR